MTVTANNAVCARLEAGLVRLDALLAVHQRRLAHLQNSRDIGDAVPVLNAQAFSRELNKTWMYCQLADRPLCVMVLELEQKQDGGQAPVPKTVLAIAAACLEQNTRSCDKIGLVGGGRLAVMLDNVCEDQAGDIARRLKQAQEADSRLDNWRFTMNVTELQTGEAAASALARLN